jgi:hypothetical protein
MRLPTLRQVGIAGAAIGLVALVAKPAWDWFWPAPIATIDAPDANTRVSSCFVAKGRVLPSTIWRPLWLIATDDRGQWRPEKKIDPSLGIWQHEICPGGSKTGVALILAADELDLELRRKSESTPEDDLPDWLKHYGEQQGGRGRRHRDGSDPLPTGARLVAFVQVYSSWYGKGNVTGGIDGVSVYVYPEDPTEPVRIWPEVTRTRHRGYGRLRAPDKLRATLY